MAQDNLTNETHDSEIPEIVFNYDNPEIDLENIEFTPVNRGLGFHKEENRIIAKPVSRNRTATIPVKAKGRTITPIKRELPQVPRSSIGISDQLNISMPTKALYEESKQEQKLSKKVEANYLIQFGAWAIDLFMIVAFTVLTGFALLYVSGVTFTEITKIVNVSDLSIFVLTVFSTYYLTFFSIFDLVGSPGKNMFDLKLVSLSGGDIEIKSTLTRAFVTFASLFLAGIPSAFDFQGKLSDSVVIQNRDV